MQDTFTSRSIVSSANAAAANQKTRSGVKKTKKLTAVRHDEALKLVLTGIINKSKMGSYCAVADVGITDSCEALCIKHSSELGTTAC